MSDDDKSSPEQRYLVAARSIKADIDLFFAQLRSGAYASPDTFANNWAHLIRVINEIRPILSEPGVTETLLQKDRQLMTDLQAIACAVEIIENFLVCLQNMAGRDNGKPH
ncbi:hypothetical protein [Pantoea stewartii]|uniref:hypothetical protein n=1 Tax=Pantoea stewartii TaxID=66269 RepID=UPI00249E2C95|nr:hypothetical protein [Pantoea stewartii]